MKQGDKAPAFTLDSDGGSKVSLSDFKGKTLVVYFYPKDDTPGCTREAIAFSAALGRFAAAGASVVGVSKDTVAAHAKFRAKYALTVPLLSDYDHSVARAYDIAYDSFLPEKNLGQAGVPKRSAFIVDASGVIQYAESNDSPGVLPDFAAIKAKLAELQ